MAEKMPVYNDTYVQLSGRLLIPQSRKFLLGHYTFKHASTLVDDRAIHSTPPPSSASRQRLSLMTPLPRFDVMSCRPSSSRGSGGIFWLLSLSLSLLISHYTFLDEREGGAAGDKSIPPSFPRVFELVLETDRRSVSLALCLPPRDATEE